MNTDLGTRTALNLYRRLIRYGQQLQLTDKEYYFRRVKGEFRRNRSQSDPAAVQFSLMVCVDSVYNTH